MVFIWMQSQDLKDSENIWLIVKNMRLKGFQISQHKRWIKCHLVMRMIKILAIKEFMNIVVRKGS